MHLGYTIPFINFENCGTLMNLGKEFTQTKNLGINSTAIDGEVNMRESAKALVNMHFKIFCLPFYNHNKALVVIAVFRFICVLTIISSLNL